MQTIRNQLQLRAEIGRISSIAIAPYIDCEPLTEMVSAFERGQGYEPVGGYAALIPGWFRYGPLDQYYLGLASSQYFAELQGIYVLTCFHCGQVGCWPLVCAVSHADETVIWSKFRQPHRPKRDYSGFGPFIFDRTQYDAAVTELVAQLPPDA